MTLMTVESFSLGEFIHRVRPHRDGEADEQHRLDHGDDAFELGRGMACDAVVIGLGIAAFVEAKEHVKEITDPADKQRRPSTRGHK